jgi:hypothetical protein
MEFGHFEDPAADEPTAAQRLEARNLVMVNEDGVFAPPEGCDDCETFSNEAQDIALGYVRQKPEYPELSLAAAARSLCAFRDECNGADRDADGKWLGCGTRLTPMG